MSSRAVVYAGLDIGSSSCHLVTLDADGKKLMDQAFTTSESNLIRVFDDLQGEVHVHLEASTLTAWIRRTLKPRVAAVRVSHAKTNAWIARDPRKKDQVDSFKLAELLRLGRIHEVYYPDEDHRTVFKQLVQHFDDITRQVARLKNKIKARLRAQGVIAKGENVYKPLLRDRWLMKVQSRPASVAIQQLFDLMDQSTETRKKALKLLRQESKRYPEINQFLEVPGVGIIGACRFSGYIQTPHRFSNRRKLWSYCRLGITDRTSDGKPLGRKRLDRNGNGLLKHMSRTTFMGAMKTKADNAFKRFYRESLHRTHDSTHSRLSTQRKILSVLHAMWLRGENYQDDRN